MRMKFEIDAIFFVHLLLMSYLYVFFCVQHSPAPIRQSDILELDIPLTPIKNK